LVTLPLTVLAFLDTKDRDIFPIVCLTGNVSLMPLLFRPQEASIRALLVALHAAAVAKFTQERQVGLLERVYGLGLLAVWAFDQFLAPWSGIRGRFPFLPLMCYSVYCALGLSLCYFLLYKNMLLPVKVSKKKHQ